MTDEDWLNLYAEFRFTERQRYETDVLSHKQALAEILNAAFGKEND